MRFFLHDSVAHHFCRIALKSPPPPLLSRCHEIDRVLEREIHYSRKSCNESQRESQKRKWDEEPNHICEESQRTKCRQGDHGKADEDEAGRRPDERADQEQWKRKPLYRKAVVQTLRPGIHAGCSSSHAMSGAPTVGDLRLDQLANSRRPQDSPVAHPDDRIGGVQQESRDRTRLCLHRTTLRRRPTDALTGRDRAEISRIIR